MGKGEFECDAIKKIIEELDETLRSLEKIEKKMEGFHIKTFRRT